MEDEAVRGHVILFHILLWARQGEALSPLRQQQPDSIRDRGDEEVGGEDARGAEGARLAKVGGDQDQLGGEQVCRRRLQGQGPSRHLGMVSSVAFLGFLAS